MIFVYKTEFLKCLVLCLSDLKLVNNGCEGRWSSAAVVQQAHTSVVVADISGKNQELCFSGQEDVCNPLALLPERTNKGDGDGGEAARTGTQVIFYAFWAALMCVLCGRKGTSVEDNSSCLCVSPVSDSILQLIEYSAVQGVNIRQLIENLSEPLFVQHGFPLIPDRCSHSFPKILVGWLSCSLCSKSYLHTL